MERGGPVIFIYLDGAVANQSGDHRNGSAPQTISLVYFHQYLVTFGLSIIGGGSGYTTPSIDLPAIRHRGSPRRRARRSGQTRRNISTPLRWPALHLLNAGRPLRLQGPFHLPAILHAAIFSSISDHSKLRC